LLLLKWLLLVLLVQWLLLVKWLLLVLLALVVIEEDFDGGGGESHLDLLFDQLTRDAVVMAIDLHMIVDIDPSLFPFGKLIGRIGERFQGGLVQGFEEGPAGSRGLEFPMV
jgi:hypothetical protein